MVAGVEGTRKQQKGCCLRKRQGAAPIYTGTLLQLSITLFQVDRDSVTYGFAGKRVVLPVLLQQQGFSGSNLVNRKHHLTHPSTGEAWLPILKTVLLTHLGNRDVNLPHPEVEVTSRDEAIVAAVQPLHTEG